MATADEALNVARGELGNGPEKYWAWYGGSGYAWCCAFQSWVLSTVGIPTHYAYVSYLFNEYRNAGRTFAPQQAQPGDLVAFDYDGGGPRAYDHVAMVEYVEYDANGQPSALVCLDGNWANRVQRVRRYFDRGGYAGGIAEVARPTYTTPQPPPEEDDDVKQAIIWDKNGGAWHVCGNTRVALSSIDEFNVLKFLGLPDFAYNEGNAKWLAACAILPRNGGINTPGN